MKDMQNDLGKVRGYTYLVFFFFVAMLFHDNIADAFGTGHRRILLGFVLLTFMQLTMALMYIIKLAANVRPGGNHDQIMMYAARIRMSIFCQYAALFICVLNEYLEHSQMIDMTCILLCIFMIYFTLKNLTILQRGRF